MGDLRANTEYSGYTAASRVIQWFWECVDEMNKQDRALLVQFVTGTSKVPLDGFRALQVRLLCRLLQMTGCWCCSERAGQKGQPLLLAPCAGCLPSASCALQLCLEACAGCWKQLSGNRCSHPALIPQAHVRESTLVLPRAGHQ